MGVQAVRRAAQYSSEVKLQSGPGSCPAHTGPHIAGGATETSCGVVTSVQRGSEVNLTELQPLAGQGGRPRSAGGEAGQE